MAEDDEIKMRCAVEAIEALGLLLPAAASAIAAMIDASSGIHPRQLALEYRKAGTQIPDAVKKSIGVRKNGFISVEALADIAERGMLKPLLAHETTLLRAFFSYSRHLKAWAYSQYPNATVRYDCLNMGTCAGCRRLHKTTITPGAFSPFPPTDCETDTCNAGVWLCIDFLTLAN